MSFLFKNTSGSTQTQHVPGYDSDSWLPGRVRAVPATMLRFFRAAVNVFTETVDLDAADLTNVQYSGPQVTQFTRHGVVYDVSYSSGLVMTIVGGGVTWTFGYSGTNLISVTQS
ncbi:MAG: hypothetical protein JWN23_1555 [Rhodocyclales bacterium]|nr:hypothetical protein [Rhodocyclales bacterium]